LFGLAAMKDKDMDENKLDFTQEFAAMIGESVERTSAFVIDQVEDLSLWVMEKANESNPDDENLAQVGKVLHSMRKVMAQIPQAAGSLAAVSTLIGLRLSRDAMQAMKKFRDGQYPEA
jgi:hypothetical protein